MPTMISYLAHLSMTSDARHLDKFPRRGHLSDRHLDQCRNIASLERTSERNAQLLRVAGALGFGTEALRIAHEIGIAEIACDYPVAILLLLDPPHIAEGAVVEYDDCERNAVMHGCRQLIGGKEKAAVPRDRHHRHVAPRVRRAERGCKSPPQIVLISGRQKCARLVDREQETR